MTDNDLEIIHPILLVTVSGGSLTTAVKTRLTQIWSHEGKVRLSGPQTFEGMNGGSVFGHGHFTIQPPGLTGAREKRAYTANIVHGSVEKIRTHSEGTIGFIP